MTRAQRIIAHQINWSLSIANMSACGWWRVSIIGCAAFWSLWL